MNLSKQRKLDFFVGVSLIALLKPITFVLGKLLSRDHDLKISNQLVVLKILGGGSLIMSYQALFSIRQKYPDKKITIICSDSVKVFAELMGIFDEYLVIEVNKGLLGFIKSCLRVLKSSFRADCIIDFEVHSKLTTIFCLLTCARNRVGFYQEWNNWQRGLSTHLLFFNNSSATHTAYNHVVHLLDAELVSTHEVRDHFIKENGIAAKNCSKNFFENDKETFSYGLSPFCSDLGKEREFTAEEWCLILESKMKPVTNMIIHLLGGPADIEKGKIFQEKLLASFPKLKIVNTIGQMKLRDSVRYISDLDVLLTIDSGLNHLTRYTNIGKIYSYWGATDPSTRLNVIKGLDEEITYNRIFCSPCVHVVHTAPCNGMNVCMKQYVGLDVSDYEKVGWR